MTVRAISTRLTLLFSLISLLIATTSFIACSSDDGMDDDYEAELKDFVYHPNNRRLSEATELKVLAIGNSFTHDATAYINELADSMGLDKKRFCIYVMNAAGASLSYWNKIYRSHKVDSAYRMAGQIYMPVIKAPMADIIAQNWDVVVLQQYSGDADKYYTFNPSLSTLTKTIRRHCTNSNVMVAWNLTHSYGPARSGSAENSQSQWERIVKAAKMVMKRDSLDFVIPSGTALQNARHTVLNNKSLLTLDDIHIGFGTARYVTACTWVETLLSPMFATSVTGRTGNHIVTDSETNGRKHNSEDWKADVTEANRELCQQCALQACRSPFEVTMP